MNTMTVPNTVHFCYFGGRPLSLVNYVAVKAAAVVNNPDKINFYYASEPDGEWWNKIKQYCEPIKMKPILEAFGQKLVLPAHMADLWRLQKLCESGGIYLDLDVICNKPFTDLRKYSVVLGQEKANGKIVGLGSAAILATPQANFMKRWWEGYDPSRSLWKGFRTAGHDIYWTEMIIKYPYFLSQYWAEEIEVIPFEQFYGVGWSEEDLKRFYETSEEIPDAYVYHLWSNSAYGKYLKDVSEKSIKSQDTNFSKLVLKYLQ